MKYYLTEAGRRFNEESRQRKKDPPYRTSKGVTLGKHGDRRWSQQMSGRYLRAAREKKEDPDAEITYASMPGPKSRLPG
jgi:hypothetical protein